MANLSDEASSRARACSANSEAHGWPLAIAMSAAMIGGNWVGNQVIERLPTAHFRLLIGGLLGATAIQMIVTG